MTIPPVKIKTFGSFHDREHLEAQVHEWLDKNKDAIEVINVISVSTPSRVGVVYTITVVYIGA
jgi:hypothetical protein